MMKYKNEYTKMGVIFYKVTILSSITDKKENNIIKGEELLWLI